MMMKTLLVTFALAAGCATHTSSGGDPVITGDQCEVYSNAQTCDAHAGCNWFELGIACQVGQPCVSGRCSSTSGGGGGGGGSGHGSGSAACACFDGGVCYEQLGGPAVQSPSPPPIECYPPSACPGGCASVCDEIMGQGHCTLDPNVANLCLCDNGVR